MKLTAHDLGQITLRQDGHAPPSHAVPAEEKRRRLAIAKRAREQFPSLSAMSRKLGLRSGVVSQWFTGVRPVPEKHLPALEALASKEGEE